MRRIKYEIFKSGKTGRQVAAAAEIAPETLSRILCGAQEPGYKRGQSAERIAAAVGWTGDVRELFSEVEQ